MRSFLLFIHLAGVIVWVGGMEVYRSNDGGASFGDLKLNLPPVTVTDMEIKHGDLVIGACPCWPGYWGAFSHRWPLPSAPSCCPASA